jgi:hypothetical protein
LEGQTKSQRNIRSGEAASEGNRRCEYDETLTHSFKQGKAVRANAPKEGMTKSTDLSRSSQFTECFRIQSSASGVDHVWELYEARERKCLRGEAGGTPACAHSPPPRLPPPRPPSVTRSRPPPPPTWLEKQTYANTHTYIHTKTHTQIHTHTHTHTHTHVSNAIPTAPSPNHWACKEPPQNTVKSVQLAHCFFTTDNNFTRLKK